MKEIARISICRGPSRVRLRTIERNQFGSMTFGELKELKRRMAKVLFPWILERNVRLYFELEERSE